MSQRKEQQPAALGVWEQRVQVGDGDPAGLTQIPQEGAVPSWG